MKRNKGLERRQRLEMEKPPGREEDVAVADVAGHCQEVVVVVAVETSVPARIRKESWTRSSCCHRSLMSASSRSR